MFIVVLIVIVALIVFVLFFTEFGKELCEQNRKYNEGQKLLTEEEEKTRRVQMFDGKYLSVVDRQLRHVQNKTKNQYAAVLAVSHYGDYFEIQPLKKDGSVSKSKTYWSSVKKWKVIGVIKIPYAERKSTTQEIKEYEGEQN